MHWCWNGLCCIQHGMRGCWRSLSDRDTQESLSEKGTTGLLGPAKLLTQTLAASHQWSRPREGDSLYHHSHPLHVTSALSHSLLLCCHLQTSANHCPALVGTGLWLVPAGQDRPFCQCQGLLPLCHVCYSANIHPTAESQLRFRLSVTTNICQIVLPLKWFHQHMMPSMNGHVLLPIPSVPYPGAFISWREGELPT